MIIENMKTMIEIQGRDGNWDYDPYMHGLYNGMEMMLSIAEGRGPVFRKAPEVWRSEIVCDMIPVAEESYQFKADGKTLDNGGQ
jgi:hypothetical protein